MLGLLGRVVIGRPRLVLAVTALVVFGAGAVGIRAFWGLSPAGYEVGGAESTRATALLADQFRTGAPNLVVVVTANGGDIDAPEVEAEALLLVDEVSAETDVAELVSYWTAGRPAALRSDRGDRALVAARVLADEDEVYDRIAVLRPRLESFGGEIDVAVGGSGAVNLDLVEETRRDTLRAELIAIPLTTLLLLWVFRSVVGALLPLLVSAVVLAGTTSVLVLLSDHMLVSVFALNIATAIGLGVSVDFSLFLLSRYREEREAGRDVVDAVLVMIRTAGRSVLFSGLTTGASIGALFVFELPLLRSIALGSTVAVMFGLGGALIALPAALVLLGDRVEWGGVASRGTEQAWRRLTRWVMSHPWPVVLVTVGVLAALGAPFLRAEFTIPDDRFMPSSSPSRQVSEVIRSEFEVGELAPVVVVSENGSVDDQLAADYAKALSTFENVHRVDAASGTWSNGILGAVPGPFHQRFANASAGQYFSVVSTIEPISPEGEELVRAIRSDEMPFPILVGGESARLVDNKDAVLAGLPVAVALIIGMVFVLLLAMFRSVVVPLKAILLNTLSLAAMYGAMVWIFQDGHLSGLLGFEATGRLDVYVPVLTFCIAFGLSMDYEVFLLSRIKERYDLTGDTEQAVVDGVGGTARIITSAAILMAVVFFAFGTGRVLYSKIFGISLGLAILIDATIIRALLLPALMRLAGPWNWWAPKLFSGRLPVSRGTTNVARDQGAGPVGQNTNWPPRMSPGSY